MAEPDHYWFERKKVLEAAQARYLWVLLVLMLFYAALHLQTGPDKGSTKVPILDLEISPILVLSSGTPMLSLIVLAIVGSRRAIRRARGVGLEGRTSEEFDLHPNVIDLAFYHLPGSSEVFVHLARGVYTIFLSLALGEAVWLFSYMADARLPPPYIVVIMVQVPVDGAGPGGHPHLDEARD